MEFQEHGTPKDHVEQKNHSGTVRHKHDYLNSISRTY